MVANMISEYDSLLIKIVEYVYDADISDEADAYELAKLSFLDALGCASESIATNSDCHKLIGPYMVGTTVPNGFKVPATNFVMDPVKGAFDLSVLIRYLDHNDGFTGLEWGHPSDTLGAICSVADCVARSRAANGIRKTPTITDILVGLIKSYEIQGRLQLANALNQRGLDHVFFEQLAACAVISGPSLLNLTREQALAALSFCILDNAPLRAYRHAPNTIPRKGWAAASAVSRAVQLALIARSDQPGAPTALSAPRWGFEATVLGKGRGSELCDALTGLKKLEFGGPKAALTRTYVVRNVFYKLMPCEGHSLTAVEACVRVSREMRERNIEMNVNDIDKINIRTHNGAVLIISKPADLKLRNAADRDHCLEFMLAVTLLKGAPPVYSDYADEAVWTSDERVDVLRSKMVVIEDEQFSNDYHDPGIRSMASGVSIDLVDGQTVGEVVIEHPLGSPRHAATENVVMRKVRKNLNLTYDVATVDRIVAMVTHESETSAKSLFDLLWKGN